MKRCFTILLVLLLLVSMASAASATDAAFSYETSDWAYDDVTKVIDLNILDRDWFVFTDLRQPISRGDFAVNSAYLVASAFGSNMDSYLLIMNYRGMAESNEYPFLYVSQVIEDLGIIKGREDGDWDAYSTITRQEAAVMLARAYRAYQDTMPDTMKPLTFTDQGDIADWALEGVRLMNHLGVMTGLEDGRFDPLGLYTKEQCAVTLLRLYEKAPYDGSKQENPFAISKRAGGFLKVWDESNQTYSFAIETEDYYICALVRSSSGSGIGSLYYEIQIVDLDFSLRSYPTPILRSSSSRGEIHARPENPILSEDGTKLFYTATLQENAYATFYDQDGIMEQTLLFLKGIYTVTMDLKTGEQTYARADLTKS